MKLLSISGFIPEQICDTVRFTQYAGGRSISHYCGYMSDYISQAMEDETVDGAVYPRSCDSSRIISSYLDGSGKFAYQLNVPARQDELAVDYFSGNIREYKSSVERYFQISIKDVEERAWLVNERNRALAEVYKEIESLSFSGFLGRIHELLKKPLREQTIPTQWKEKKPTGKRVFVAGSFLSNLHVADAIEHAGMTIVGDNLTESGRLVTMEETGRGGDIYKNIARSILRNRLSPTQDNFRAVINRDLEYIACRNVKGVVFVTQKYCEPYDYLYSVYKSILDDRGIPNIKICLSDSENPGKAELMAETFADML